MPSAAARSATARPMPLAPPVITATLPRRSSMSPPFLVVAAVKHRSAGAGQPLASGRSPGGTAKGKGWHGRRHEILEPWRRGRRWRAPPGPTESHGGMWDDGLSDLSRIACVRALTQTIGEWHG